jgi:hypothetical protein
MRSGSSRAGDDARRPTSAKDIDALADWLDTKFKIPGTGFRFGLDSLIGLIPGVGDAATLAAGLYIVARVVHLGAPAGLVARMLVSLGTDAVLGAIPIVGDVFDFAFKANAKNAERLRRHLRERS